MKYLLNICCSFLLCSALLDAQVIEFANPSFEDLARHSKTPTGWLNCGPEYESPPDIQPNLTFQVTKPALDGDTYLGMVTRDNDTWESVGTKLSSRLEKGKNYAFDIALARSLTYYSVSRSTNQAVNYNRPVKLRIWGGRNRCDRAEMLAQSPQIESSDWEMFTFNLAPQEGNYDYLILEVYYKVPILFPYNGNLLVDAASFIYPTSLGSNITLLPAKYYKSETALITRLSTMLDGLVFNDQNELITTSFHLEEKEEILLIEGHPSLFGIEDALQYSDYDNWELVVFDGDAENQAEKVAYLVDAARLFPDLTLRITPYDTQQHEGTQWECMSTENGMYLRVVRD